MLHNARAAELGVVRRRPAGRAGRRPPPSRCCAAGDAGRGRPVAARAARPTARPRCSPQVRPLGDGFTMVEAADTSEAVRLEATRRDFVANVSHELKTPVGAIGLLAEAVLDAADDPDEVRRFGTKILNESTRLGNLVTELIALSRLHRRRAAARAGRGRRRRDRRGRRCAAAGSPREAAGIEIIVDAPSGLTGRRRPDAAGHRAVQPGRQRDRLLAAAGVGVGLAAAGRRAGSRSRSPTAASASPPSTRSGSSSGSSGSTRPAPGPPAAPGSGWPSSSTCCQPRRRGAAVEQPGHRLHVHHAAAPLHGDARHRAVPAGADRGGARRGSGRPAAPTADRPARTRSPTRRRRP